MTDKLPAHPGVAPKRGAIYDGYMADQENPYELWTLSTDCFWIPTSTYGTVYWGQLKKQDREKILVRHCCSSGHHSSLDGENCAKTRIDSLNRKLIKRRDQAFFIQSQV